jgi:phospholipid N-methyltransferase
MDFGRARTVVQLGVGTGCITRALLQRLQPEARLLAVEVNGVFVDTCRRIRDDRLILRHGCAGSLPEMLHELGAGEVDYVVSSLPLAIMDDALVARILRVSRAALAPGGLFLQYQYSLSQRAALERQFDHVRVGFTLANIPPAFVYECSRSAERLAAG